MKGMRIVYSLSLSTEKISNTSESDSYGRLAHSTQTIKKKMSVVLIYRRSYSPSWLKYDDDYFQFIRISRINGVS